MAHQLTIALTGDVMLGRQVDKTIAKRGPAYPWGDLVRVLIDADLLLVNLECALTTESKASDDGQPKLFSFRADPVRGAQVLAEVGVDFASLANNHAADFGLDGLMETVSVLDSARVAHAGAGVNASAARMPALLNADGLRVAVVAFADYPPEWAATAESAGTSYLLVSTAPKTIAIIKDALAAARKESDLVIFSIHWGPNMCARPNDVVRTFAHRVIDAGADVFWGHSAHVVQGIEVWNGKPILYDTGDFIDDYAVDPMLRNDRSGLFLLRVVPPVIERIDVLPVEIRDCQVNRAGKQGRAWFAQWLKERSAELGCSIHDDGEVLTVRLPTLTTAKSKGAS